MDDARRSALTLLGFAVLVAFAAGSQRRTSISSDAGMSTTTSAAATFSAATTSGDASAADPDPETVPDPATDYTSLEDAKLDGNKAFGKTVLFRVWRGATDATKATIYACGKLGMGGYMDATYSADKRALVKAIPTTIPLQGRCPRVVVKLTGKQPDSNDFKGELQQILDVTPRPPEPLPPGVDYVSMDDVNIDGKKAAGKIALFSVYRGNTEEKKFTAYPCSRSGGLNFLNVNFTPEQKDMVKDLSTSPVACQPIKVKLTTQQPYVSTWNSTLIEVQKGE